MEVLVFNLLITAVGYLIVPLIIIIIGRKYSESKLKKITIINGIAVWFIFSIISINAGGEASKGTATILWTFLGYFWMKKYCVIEQHVTTNANDTEQEIKETFANNVQCPECGEINKEGSTACVKCGYPFVKEKRNSRNKNHIFIVATVIVMFVLGILGISYLERSREAKDILQKENNENYENSDMKAVSSILKKYNKGFSPTSYDSVKVLLDERGDFGGLEGLESHIEFVNFFDYNYDYDYDNDLIFTNEYVEAVNNAQIGNVGNYYYYISSQNEAAIDEIINALK